MATSSYFLIPLLFSPFPSGNLLSLLKGDSVNYPQEHYRTLQPSRETTEKGHSAGPGPPRVMVATIIMVTVIIINFSRHLKIIFICTLFTIPYEISKKDINLPF